MVAEPGTACGDGDVLRQIDNKNRTRRKELGTRIPLQPLSFKPGAMTRTLL